MFCCTLLYVHSSIAIILMGKRELIALLNLSSWCLVMVERLFLAVPQGSLQFVIVVFPDHIHLLFLVESHTNTICALFSNQLRKLYISFPNRIQYMYKKPRHDFHQVSISWTCNLGRHAFIQRPFVPSFFSQIDTVVFDN